jgi:hypothetical protein
MITVRVDHPLEKTLGIVRMLRNDGYVQGTHFDFAFNPTKTDEFSYHNISNRHTIFTFYDEELAMMFALKYSS